MQIVDQDLLANSTVGGESSAMLPLGKRIGSKTGWTMVLAAIVGILGACGDGGGTGRPDTGYGAAQPVPATITCADLCQRAADCAGHLCDEDTNSTRYTPLIPLLSNSCRQSTCTDAQLSAAVTATQWQCLFHDSCRQVFGEGACGTANTSYSCQ